MKLICPKCRHSIEYASEQPRFCSHCGEALSHAGAMDFDSPTRSIPHQALDQSTLTAFGASSAAVRHYEIGREIGGYRLTRKIGAGAMGAVFEAEHPSSRQRVAIKLISPDIAMSPTAVERFRMEGKLASTIAHPRCVFVLAADEDVGQPYIVMELMPGTTLTSHIEQRGPLSVQEAIRKILDVIDGLQEAHRLGVIHRDVKPSNCFIDERGRVKVGDFGLAKSTQTEGELTQSGTFVGTVLFASPEQIKLLPLDTQSDVYSVCATLYFLLTGKAPFSGGDALSAATRIVTEAAPSMRTLRPDLPVGLDRVVLRGLERDKGKRWPDLDSLREALVQFLPGQHSFGGLGSRYAAHILDWLIRSVLLAGLALVLTDWFRIADTPLTFQRVRDIVGFELVFGLLIWCLYYGISEGIWGSSPGKRLMRLRISPEGGVEPPGVPRALVRSVVSFSSIHVGQLLTVFIVASGVGAAGADQLIARASWLGITRILVEPIGYLVGIGLMCSTMRMRNGYRGLHEIASGTRVLELPPRRRRRRRFADVPFKLHLMQPIGMPTRIGRFEVLGAVRWHEEDRSLVGVDPALNRHVWITMKLRPPDEAERRRQRITRPTRIRWVASGFDDGWHWEAYLAPVGVPLPAIVAREQRLLWVDAAPILEQLTDELTAACSDGTVPELVSPHQVWIDEGGRLQLLGTPLTGDESVVTSPDVSRQTDKSSEQRSLMLLRDVASSILEGRSELPERQRRFHAPIPRFASQCINRLFPSVNAYGSPRELRDDLRRIIDRPAEVPHARRVGHLAALFVLMAVSVGILLAFATLSPLGVETGAILRDQQMFADLQQVSRFDLALALIQPDQGVRHAGLAIYADDAALAANLERQIEKVRQRRDARLESMSAPIRSRFTLPEQRVEAVPLDDILDHDVRNDARTVIDPAFTLERRIATAQWLLLFAGPVVWMIWAFLTRGGLSFRFFGLELVRDDGRKAARWQCLMRAMVFWTPLLALWGASIWLDQYFWSHWHERGFRESFKWMTHLSWFTWWLGAATLGAYFVLAAWRPMRSWHDRIAGTWLVPRS